MKFESQRRELAFFMRRLYKQGLTTTTGGNISCRTDHDYVLITPATIDKGRLRAVDIVVLAPDGRNLTPELRVSSETQMHLSLYEACPAARAIVHAHPLTASAFTAARTPINCRLLAESWYQLGEPVLASYALTGTQELADSVAAAARQGCCILMENHGVTTYGGSLMQAFDRLELLEAAARMTLIVRNLEGVHPLSPDQIEGLNRLLAQSSEPASAPQSECHGPERPSIIMKAG